MRRNSRDGSHFLVQINFAGRMVSSQTLFAGPAIPGARITALLVPEIFRWSNGF